MTINEKVSFNIRYMAKKKGIKIGDLEKQLDVRTGYFSRKIKSDSSTSIEVVYNAAQILETTVDYLCSDSLIHEVEEFVNEFGYKLVENKS